MVLIIKSVCSREIWYITKHKGQHCKRLFGNGSGVVFINFCRVPLFVLRTTSRRENPFRSNHSTRGSKLYYVVFVFQALANHSIELEIVSTWKDSTNSIEWFILGFCLSFVSWGWGLFDHHSTFNLTYLPEIIGSDMLLLALPPAVAEACEVATAAACAAAAAAAAAAAGFNAAGFEAWAAMGTSDVRSLKWHKIFQPFLRGTAHENLWPEFSFEFNYFGGRVAHACRMNKGPSKAWAWLSVFILEYLMTV